MLKVRCSNGLQVSAYHGNFLQHVFHTELELGSIDADKTIGVLFSHDGKLDPQLDAHFQTALLYTTASGERRVRCINIVAAVNSGGMDTMRSLDQDAIVNIIAKEGKCSSVRRVSQYSLTIMISGVSHSGETSQRRSHRYNGESGTNPCIVPEKLFTDPSPRPTRAPR